MDPIKLPCSLNDIDSDLDSFNWTSDSEIIFDPNLIKKFDSQLLYESALIQWVLTRWRQIKLGSCLSIDCKEEEIELLKRISDSTPGAILALLPNGKIKNVSRRSTAIFREKFLNNQQSWPDLAVNESSAILCLDSDIQGLPKQIYANHSLDQITDWDGFRKVIEGLITSVAAESEVRGKISERADRINTIVLELFKNTNDHARHSVDGKIIGDSIRGLYARFYPIDKLSTSISSRKEESLNQAERYVNQLMKPPSIPHLAKTKRDLTGFLELTVFDSGPGLAAKWLSSDLSGESPQTQLEAVLDCFGKGRSSLASSSRGFGLWKVLAELKQLKGMIRVRTNRVHVQREYAMLEERFMDQHSDGYSSPKVVLLDWRRGLTQKLSEYPAIEGTVISVLLPLGDL